MTDHPEFAGIRQKGIIDMELKEAIESRRALRSLVPADIDRALIEELARCAALSASCFNNQPWRYDFVAGGEKLEEMYDALAKGNEWARKASMIVAVHSKVEDDCRVGGRDYFLFDTGMATATMILRAVDLGLVAHPIAGFDGSRVKEILGIGEDETVITLVIVGKHADRIDPILSDKQKKAERERPERMPLGDFIRIFD
jgi:nitroreductase